MKKIIILILVLLALLVGYKAYKKNKSGVLSQVKNEIDVENNVPDDWKIFKSQKFGYQINYPSDWVLNDLKNELPPEMLGSNIIISNPKSFGLAKKIDGDGGSLTVRIMESFKSPRVDIPNASIQTIEQWKNGMKNSRKNELTISNDKKIGGMMCGVATQSGTISSYCINGERGYLFQFGYLGEKDIANAEKIMGTFKLD